MAGAATSAAFGAEVLFFHFFFQVVVSCNNPLQDMQMLAGDSMTRAHDSSLLVGLSSNP